MQWKDDVPYFRELPEEEIPSELLEGLARLSCDATLLKVRFRWRPYDTPSTGFLTKDGLLELGSASNLEIAQALGSYARYLWASGACEARFEAQVYRELTSETMKVSASGARSRSTSMDPTQTGQQPP